MNISVIGTGYVGLVTGTCFAESGNQVLCVDNNPEKLALLKSGQVPIYEPGLEDLFGRNIKEGRLNFSSSLQEAIDFADIIFYCLPTPPKEDGSADLKYVLEVAKETGKLLKTYKIIVNKSTVPVGTTELVKNAISENTTVEFDVVSNPEFLREGTAVPDFLKPERIVVGTKSEKVIKAMIDLYGPFVQDEDQIIFMDERSSEMTKYASNSFLATKISFINEVANLCQQVGANIDLVAKGMGPDSRIGNKFLDAGIGYGGSCFPKDVSALHKIALDNNYNFKILEAVMDVNENQKKILVEKIVAYYGTDLSNHKFAIWGLAFKPNTDDIREAAALTIIDLLLKHGAQITAYDPEAIAPFKKFTDYKIDYVESQYDALENADALLVLTEWGEFQSPDFTRIKSLLKKPVIFDGRNVYPLEKMRELGFYYESVGRNIVK